MSQTLTVLWTAPTPDSGLYQFSYRAQGLASYTTVNTSASPVSIYSLPPANYEGYVQSSCRTTDPPSLSAAVPFGVNSWQPIYITGHAVGTQLWATITSLYPNPYPVVVTATSVWYNDATSGSSDFTLTYPAGTTFYNAFVGVTIGGTGLVSTSTYITSIAPIFDNGGSLQQFDSTFTPEYFAFYNTSGCTSGVTSGCTTPTWNGSAITLPSFILRGFNVTSVDGSGDPLSGNILVQWIQDAVYGGGLGIYSHITFNVYDPDTTLMGTVTVPYGQPGLNNATIPISKVTAPLSISSEFTMKTLWADTSVSATKLFYLPTF